MAKVRRFSTDVPRGEPAGQGEQGAPQAHASAVRNAVPDLPREIVDNVTANA